MVAVPSPVVAVTPTTCAHGFDRLTVKFIVDVPALPSAIVTSVTEIVGRVSSFWMVPTAEAADSPTLVGSLSVSVTGSSTSTSVSPFTTTSTVALVAPAANVTTSSTSAT